MRRIRDQYHALAAACLGASLYAVSAAAQSAPQEPPNPVAGLPSGPNLLGDMGGLRPGLAKYGVTLRVQEISELLGNVSGGIARGASYNGVTLMSLTAEDPFGLSGGSFYASALQIHGRSITADKLLVLQTATGFEAERTTRLWELWYQQKFGLEDRFDIKIGQQAADEEFIASSGAALFLNAALGWPVLAAVDLPGGGPVYPLAALGIRARVRPADNWAALLGVFNGNPAPSTDGDPQALNPSGLSFPLNGGALVIGEVQYSIPAVGTLIRPAAAETLPGTYRLGFWYDSEKFADQARDSSGLSLASPAGSGAPLLHRGQFALYAVADQMVWRDPDDSGHSVSLFARAMGTPQADRSPLDFALNAGITLKKPLAGRDDDKVGIGMGYAHVSPRLADDDRALQFFDPGVFTPVRSGEAFIEATYQYQATPWLMVQPDFQYFFNPGGGTADAVASTRRVGDEAVLGLRTTVSF